MKKLRPLKTFNVPGRTTSWSEVKKYEPSDSRSPITSRTLQASDPRSKSTSLRPGGQKVHASWPHVVRPGVLLAQGRDRDEENQLRYWENDQKVIKIKLSPNNKSYHNVILALILSNWSRGSFSSNIEKVIKVILLKSWQSGKILIKLIYWERDKKKMFSSDVEKVIKR